MTSIWLTLIALFVIIHKFRWHVMTFLALYITHTQGVYTATYVIFGIWFATSIIYRILFVHNYVLLLQMIKKMNQDSKNRRTF